MDLLAAVAQSRKAFEQALAGGVVDTFDDRSLLVYKAIKEYYGIDANATCVDYDIIQDRVFKAHPKHKAIFSAIIERIKEPVSIPNILAEINNAKKQDVKDRLASACTVHGNEEKILQLIEEYKTYVRANDDSCESITVYSGTSVSDILSARSNEHTIFLLPKSLNIAAGNSVLRKHHILFFARPDAGKSTLGINLTAGFLRQKLKVLYVGNEDPPQDIIMRMMTRITNRTEKEVAEDPELTERLLAERDWDKFIFVELTPGTPRELEALMDEHRPDVLIVDQSRNINMKEDNRVMQLEKVEAFIRNLGKQYNALTISFTQAGASAEGKLVLELTDVDYSNTGMAASADLMVGMGTSIEYTQNGERVLTCVKNKMSGGSKEPFKIRMDHRYNRVS